ncbi:MAG: transketolase [Candidatus Methanoperedens sp.]
MKGIKLKMKDLNCDDIRKLKDKATVIRRHIIKMVYSAGSGHPGGSLSSTDILVVLFFHVMKHNPQKKDREMDRFILSKGHAAPALYATLAESGYFPISKLESLRKNGGYLQGHPDSSVPGVEVSSGSLGQGLSCGNGIALAARLDEKSSRVFVLLGDGECDEGQVWEAAMLSAHFKLDNLVAIVDRNGLQIDGKTEQIMCLEPFSKKWESFGWHVIEIDGNNIEEIIKAFKETECVIGKPTVIIARTFKGKGVSFMEGNLAFHGKAPTDKEMICALEELK